MQTSFVNIVLDQVSVIKRVGKNFLNLITNSVMQGWGAGAIKVFTGSSSQQYIFLHLKATQLFRRFKCALR